MSTMDQPCNSNALATTSKLYDIPGPPPPSKSSSPPLSPAWVTVEDVTAEEEDEEQESKAKEKPVFGYDEFYKSTEIKRREQHTSTEKEEMKQMDPKITANNPFERFRKGWPSEEVKVPQPKKTEQQQAPKSDDPFEGLFQHWFITEPIAPLPFEYKEEVKAPQPKKTEQPAPKPMASQPFMEEEDMRKNRGVFGYSKCYESCYDSYHCSDNCAQQQRRDKLENQLAQLRRQNRKLQNRIDSAMEILASSSSCSSSRSHRRRRQRSCCSPPPCCAYSSDSD